MSEGDLTVAQAAKSLGVGVSFLYTKARRREIPHQRYGSAVRFTAAQVEEIRSQHAQPIVPIRSLGGRRRSA